MNWETLKSLFLDYGIFPKSQSILKTNKGSEFFYNLLPERVKPTKNWANNMPYWDASDWSILIERWQIMFINWLDICIIFFLHPSNMAFNEKTCGYLKHWKSFPVKKSNYLFQWGDSKVPSVLHLLFTMDD